MKTSTQVAGLVGWVALSVVAGAVGAFASANAGSFYEQLQRPTWAPPAWLFAPVWSALYLMMGVAAWLVWRESAGAETRTALTLYVAQLAVNALWTWLFFAWRQGAWAFAEILVLLVLIVATLFAFWRVRPVAGLLLLPYVIWVGFASALTYATWRANPGLLG
ncbi:MAG TPA: TspO/MBR family protein [Gemmatimonadaceae bacterium]|nr:TspO/MBR family protein [Gemmatimonadaceae bacterium]